MTGLEVGRVCIKTAGREAGKLCVVVKGVDSTFVMITGPKSLTTVKRRKCNIAHLEPLDTKISIKSDAADSEVEAELKKADTLKKYSIPLFVKSIHREAVHIHEKKKKEHKKKEEKREEHKPEKKEVKEHKIEKKEVKKHKVEKKPTKKAAPKKSVAKKPAKKAPAKNTTKKK